jgi:hypothetical protein
LDSVRYTPSLCKTKETHSHNAPYDVTLDKVDGVEDSQA